MGYMGHPRPRQLHKIYLVGSSSFVLCHGTRFWSQFVSIWTQMDSSFFSQLDRRQAGAASNAHQFRALTTTICRLGRRIAVMADPGRC